MRQKQNSKRQTKVTTKQKMETDSYEYTNNKRKPTKKGFDFADA